MGVNFDSPIGRLRAKIPDYELIPNPLDPSEAEYIFPDEVLQAYLDDNNGNIRLALSDAYYALGSSEALISKVIKTEDLQTDGAKVMTQYRMQATQIRREAKSEDDNIGGLVFAEGSVPQRGELQPYFVPFGWGVC